MSTRLFVGNVNPAVTERELEEFFSDAGEVVAVSIPLNRETRTPRGFAFVEFATGEQAERAIEDLDDSVLEGRRVRLKPAYEDRRLERGGGRRGRPQRSGPDSAGHDTGDARDWREWERDDSARYRGRPRRRGKHGSDRIRGRGTRRFIE